jgi:hypothetical protein
VPEGEQEHGCIAMAVPVFARCLDEPLYLLFRQMLARAKLSIRQARRNCSIYACWRAQLEMPFWHGNLPTHCMSVANRGVLRTVINRNQCGAAGRGFAPVPGRSRMTPTPSKEGHRIFWKTPSRKKPVWCHRGPLSAKDTSRRARDRW